MNIKNKFLELTKRTYPHGTEQELFDLLPNNLNKDEFGNLFIKIGDNDVMFTSHLDTATSALTKVKHVFDGNIIKTNGKSILGADDKAGVTVMLYMIENNVPGLYYFFIGEEVGCVGSKKLAKKMMLEKIDNINKVISFDRRGTNSVITYQSGQRCASDKFAEALSEELNITNKSFSYKPDDTGVLTDSVQFIKMIPECTNISVGYLSEHTFSESQDIEHLEKLALACTKVDWSNLPVDRDPLKVEYKSYGRSYAHWDDYYDDDYYDSYNVKNKNWNKQKSENIWFYDHEFKYVSKVEINSLTKGYISVDLHKDRINKEKVMIENLLIDLELKFISVSWDGIKLVVNYDKNGNTSNANRNDLIEFIEELDYKLLEGDLDSDNSGLYENLSDKVKNICTV